MRVPTSDHFAVLGVSPFDTPDTVRRAYRARIFAVHPDRGGDAEEARLVVDAFRVLSDDEERTRFESTFAEYLASTYGRREDFSRPADLDLARATSLARQGDQYAEEALAWRSKGNTDFSDKLVGAAEACWSKAVAACPGGEVQLGVEVNRRALHDLLHKTDWSAIRAERIRQLSNDLLGAAVGSFFVSFFDTPDTAQ